MDLSFCGTGRAVVAMDVSDRRGEDVNASGDELVYVFGRRE